MITPDIIKDLHALRKQHCTCGRIMCMPEFHERGCPYIAYGESELIKAEKETMLQEAEADQVKK